MFEKMEYLPDVESALENITTSYYRNYAFLGSSALLEYIMKINYTKKLVYYTCSPNKTNLLSLQCTILHMSNQPSFLLPMHAYICEHVYAHRHSEIHTHIHPYTNIYYG